MINTLYLKKVKTNLLKITPINFSEKYFKTVTIIKRFFKIKINSL